MDTRHRTEVNGLAISAVPGTAPPAETTVAELLEFVHRLKSNEPRARRLPGSGTPGAGASFIVTLPLKQPPSR